MPTQERIQIDHLHQKTWNNTAGNAVGATTSTTLRTVTAYDDTNCKHVRKFGTAFAPQDLTNAVITTPRSAGGNAWTYTFYGYIAGSWTSMGSVKDTGGASAAFVDGAVGVSTKMKIVITPDAGDTISITNNDTITLTYDGTTKTIVLPGCSRTTELTLYLSATGSTYYDADYMYGGARHTPTGVALLPYFTITAAEAALGGAFTIVTVLDSCTYDEELTLNVASTTLQAALGQTPAICNGCGARVTREVAHDGNDSDTVYVSKTGDDANAGTWDAPLLTITHAETHVAGAIAYINIMDSETYTENVTFNQATTVEPVYGIIPTWVVSAGVDIAHASVNIHGFSFLNSGAFSIYASGNITYTGTISNNDFIDILSSNYYIYFANANIFNGVITKNIFNNGNKGIYLDTNANASATFTKNIFSYLSTGFTRKQTVASDPTITDTISNNTFYNCDEGIFLQTGIAAHTFTNNSDIDNNIFYNCSDRAIYINQLAGTYVRGGNTRYNIFLSNTVAITSDVNMTITTNCLYDNTTNFDGAGVVTNTTPITTDPVICSAIEPYRFGISANSSCFKANGSEADVGALLPNIVIAQDTITINGFILDGQSFSNNAIQKTGATDYTALTVKFCTIKNYQGIAIDDYSGATTTTTVTNCIINDNGVGIKFTRGGNTCTYNVLFNNIKYNIHSDYTINVFNHIVLWGAEYGLYLESNSGSITFKNSVVSNNSVYGIYSEEYISIFYSCITDIVNSYVTTLPAITYYNITDNPLFIDTETDGSENFNIKTIEGGYLIDSSCKEVADDGYDIGAYLVTRTVANDAWYVYQFTDNPRKVDEELNAQGNIGFESAVGKLSRWAKSHKHSFTLSYGNMQYAYEADRKKLWYFSQLIETRDNDLLEEEARFRVHFLPSAKEATLAVGTTTVSATAKTITDTAKSWYGNEHKGFYVCVQYASGSANMATDHTLQTGTVAAAGWTVDAWIGYYLCIVQSGKVYYWYISDNTATVLTLNDPLLYLDDDADATWSIVKPFKILSNNATALTVQDDDSELVSGSYAAFIDFIICRSMSESMKYSQPRYFRQQETWKMGSEFVLQEE